MSTSTQVDYSTPVTETLNRHVSIRDYSGQAIADEMLLAILNAARRSPTSSNLQAYTFVVVRHPDTLKQLAKLAGDQKHIETCAAFVAVCADIHRLESACTMHGTTLGRNLENLLVSTVDAAIAGMSLATAAESFGLGTVMIGGMRNHPVEVAALLGFPQGVYVVYGVCIGFPDEQKIAPQKPRLAQDAMIHFERYDAQDCTPMLQDYDEALAAHYRAEGRKTPDAAWTGIIAERFHTPKRPELAAALHQLGFSTE